MSEKQPRIPAGKSSMMIFIERLSIALSILLIAGAGIESRQFRPPADTSAYRQRVKDIANQLPTTIGDWQGTDEEVEPSAVRLLHPNVIVSRQYRNAVTGQGVGFLFVDVQDARDTVGHYPPICYPSQGWSTQLTAQVTRELPGRMITLTEYTFVRGVFDNDGTLVVDDFFVLPGLGTAADRPPVIAAAKDLSRRFYGVAQIQLVFTGESNAQQRQAAFEELMTPMSGLLRTVETIKDGESGEAKGEVQ